MMMIEKLENCPDCGESADGMWIYDGQTCHACGHGRRLRAPRGNPALTLASSREAARLLLRERMRRQRGDWGKWETIYPGAGDASSWPNGVSRAHRCAVFAVLESPAPGGVIHLAVSSLSGVRPTWHEMQRIKNRIAGPEATAVEVYPPHDQVVNGADMFHIWVLPGPLPFSLSETGFRR